MIITHVETRVLESDKEETGVAGMHTEGIGVLFEALLSCSSTKKLLLKAAQNLEKYPQLQTIKLYPVEKKVKGKIK